MVSLYSLGLTLGFGIAVLVLIAFGRRRTLELTGENNKKIQVLCAEVEKLRSDLEDHKKKEDKEQ